MMKTIAKHSKRKCLLNLLSVGVFATVITFTTACATSKVVTKEKLFAMIMFQCKALISLKM